MMHRTTFYIVLGASMLLASRAEARPQATGGSGTVRGGSRATTARTRCTSCASSRDSLRKNQEKLLLRIDSLRWEIDNRRLSEVERERVAQEMTRTVMALQASLDETRLSNRLDASRSTSVSSRGGAIAVEARGATKARVAPMAIVVETGYPTHGYLGVTFDGPSAEMKHPDEHVIRFYQYPRIMLVEPSSPAERAGVLVGDTLLALNGTDVVRHEISLTKLLIPDSRIVMRVQREGNSKDVRVTVGETPAYYERRQPGRFRLAPMPPSAADEAREPVTAPTPMPPPGAPMARVPVWVYSEGVAGARVETITEGLGKALGTKEGVLVIRAQPGTPAYRSGLRDGDVILSANGRSLGRVSDLRSIVARADGDEGVRLVIVRERRQRDITLRW